MLARCYSPVSEVQSPRQLSRNKAMGAGQQILPTEEVQERADVYGQGLSWLLYIITGDSLPVSRTFGEIGITKGSHCEQRGKKREKGFLPGSSFAGSDLASSQVL